MSASSSSSDSRAGIWRRLVHRAESEPSNNSRASTAAALRLDIDPPPKPWPAAQFVAFAFLIFFALLQFLPATHLRDPSDPFRSWIPVDSRLSSPSSLHSTRKSKTPDEGKLMFTSDQKSGMIHIVSWMDCLDLHMLAVLANSTLSNSRYPERIHFHFFIPKGNEEKVSYYKLKVLFPHSNLDIIGQDEIKEKMKIATSVGDYAWPPLHEIAPFVIPSTRLFKKFIYVSPDIIVKGRIEELFGVDLSHHAVAAAEDCSIHLSDCINFDVLDAVQRSSPKPWVSKNPYNKTACLPDLNVLLINSDKLEYDLMEAILWWSKVLNKGNERINQTDPALVLALHDKYLKLYPTWKVRDWISSETNHEEKLIRFDGAMACSSNHNTQEVGFGNSWEQYLPPSSSRILVG